MEQYIKPLTLNIEKTIWDEFKNIVPRTQTLNNAVVELIRERLNISEVKTI